MTNERTEHKEAPDTVRFVVLEHTDGEGLHFDLMIETGSRLATWKSGQPPEEALGRALSCARIADHRMAYLDYEGPVSGDRGHVRRRDAGVCIIEHRTPNSWHIRFEGQRLAGRFVLSRSGDEEEAWRLRALAL
ncbi:MAG: DNA polymerase ligase N-terminal domain-containing protein [Planctomycetota bacterium]